MSGKIFATGDTHGRIDIGKLFDENSEWYKTKKDLDKNDYLIVLGDFGVIWKQIPDKEEKDLKRLYDSEPYTTLFIDGNHEMHPRLNKLEKIEMFGGTVGKVSESVYHLKRGEIYTICGKKFFTFGGAVSIDRDHRIEGVSWWPEEIATHKEFEYGFDNLEKHDNKVDYILAHTCPTDIKAHVQMFRFSEYEELKFNDPTCKFLQSVIYKIDFEKFYFGHWHRDKDMGQYHCLYQDVIRIK